MALMAGQLEEVRPNAMSNLSATISGSIADIDSSVVINESRAPGWHRLLRIKLFSFSRFTGHIHLGGKTIRPQTHYTKIDIDFTSGIGYRMKASKPIMAIPINKGMAESLKIGVGNPSPVLSLLVIAIGITLPYFDLGIVNDDPGGQANSQKQVRPALWLVRFHP